MKSILKRKNKPSAKDSDGPPELSNTASHSAVTTMIGSATNSKTTISFLDILSHNQPPQDAIDSLIDIYSAIQSLATFLSGFQFIGIETSQDDFGFLVWKSNAASTKTKYSFSGFMASKT